MLLTGWLSEGGFGSVHKRVLPHGQVMIVVKQHKPTCSWGDHEFCLEVEVLNCAQHCNVLMLIGLCGRQKKETSINICNRSLDHHQYGACDL